MKVTEIQKAKVDYKALTETYRQVARELREFAIRLSKLTEAVTVPVEGDLDQQIGELTRRLDAARRGLGFVNKLSPGPEKTMHARRVMQNLNYIRVQLGRAIKALNSYEKAQQDYDYAEQEEEHGWALNTLGSIMNVNKGGGFCEYCSCCPCECDHDSRSCAACGSPHVGGEDHKVVIAVVQPGMEQTADYSDDYQDEFEHNDDPFGDEIEPRRFWHEDEEEECPECDAYEHQHGRM